MPTVELKASTDTIKSDIWTEAIDWLSKYPVTNSIGISVLEGVTKSPHSYPAFRLLVEKTDDGIVGLAWINPPFPINIVCQSCDLSRLKIFKILSDFFIDSESKPIEFQASSDICAHLECVIRNRVAIKSNVARAMSLLVIDRFDQLRRHGSSAGPESIRRATISDKMCLIEMRENFLRESNMFYTKEATENEVDGLIDRGVVFVAEIGGSIVAKVALNDCGSCRRLGSVYTCPEMRGRGIAKSLISHATAFALKHGPCCLYVDHNNSVATAIYENLGYSPLTDIKVMQFQRAYIY